MSAANADCASADGGELQRRLDAGPHGSRDRLRVDRVRRCHPGNGNEVPEMVQSLQPPRDYGVGRSSSLNSHGFTERTLIRANVDWTRGTLKTIRTFLTKENCDQFYA